MFAHFKTQSRLAFMIVLLLTLCGAATTASANRLEEIKSRGRLVCATLSGTEPLAFQDPRTRQYVANYEQHRPDDA